MSSNSSQEVKSAVKAKKRSYYLREVQQELKNVSWTSKDELTLLTKIVVGGTFVFGLGIYFSDLAIQGALGIVNTIARWILG